MNSPEKLFKCFQELRRCQAYYSKCLEKGCSTEEEEFFQELSIDSAKQVKKIIDFYKKHYGLKFLSCESNLKE
ncbi:hypothetical protein C2W64_01970 [Brevibacillus laterosporus]|nr:hypothetical protein [Brevibacillus laterosporus]RAP26426.1 hypothetical protein C2W64_01970 [Brevibacillus laterosporus]